MRLLPVRCTFTPIMIGWDVRRMARRSVMHRQRWDQALVWVAAFWLVLAAATASGASNSSATPASKATCPRASKTTFLGNTAYVKWLLPALNRARQEIVLSMFQFVVGPEASNRANQVAQALIAAAKRGVRVTVILDQPPEGDSPQAPNHQVAEQLRQHGITVQFDAPEQTTHSKLVVIDQRYVFIGSHNFTQSALRYNQEASVRIDSPRLTQQALAYLQRLETSRTAPAVPSR